jgi:hypothetical protein
MPDVEDLYAEKIMLSSLLANSRRKLNFERRWLKRKYPDIFRLMEAASEENDQQYIDSQMDKMNDLNRDG